MHFVLFVVKKLLSTCTCFNKPLKCFKIWFQLSGNSYRAGYFRPTHL